MLRILNKIRNFCRKDDGTVILEAVIIIPTLAAIITAMIVFFEAYRLKSVNLKAAYTVSDMISRKYPTVDGDYVDGLKVMYDFLVSSVNPTSMRVTMVQFDTEDPENDDDGLHILQWSHGVGDFDDLTAGTLSTIEDGIPLMGHGDSLIIVQTQMDYVPPFNVGLRPFQINNFVATRPRFIPPCWENCIN